jgi:hypothetical protein
MRIVRSWQLRIFFRIIVEIVFFFKKWFYLCTPNRKRRVGQSVKTPPFHGGMTGSTPVRGTKGMISWSFLFSCHYLLILKIRYFHSIVFARINKKIPLIQSPFSIKDKFVFY